MLNSTPYAPQAALLQKKNTKLRKYETAKIASSPVSSVFDILNHHSSFIMCNLQSAFQDSTSPLRGEGRVGVTKESQIDNLRSQN
jgi:hypothetical protein